jgi:secreted Zn-dependent insulinase-like peptidase
MVPLCSCWQIGSSSAQLAKASLHYTPSQAANPKRHNPAITAAFLHSCAREVENVHAEYSRNTNSDGRKLLQLRRSLCLPPYSNFSTGSINTLWEQPQQQGSDVAGMLRELWQQYYRAGSTCVAVVGPQEPQQLLQWVADAFADMPGSSSSSDSNAGSSGLDISSMPQATESSDSSNSQPLQQQAAAAQPQHRYPVDVVEPNSRGLLVRLLPQRDLRELQLCWYIPAGVMMHSR